MTESIDPEHRHEEVLETRLVPPHEFVVLSAYPVRVWEPHAEADVEQREEWCKSQHRFLAHRRRDRGAADRHRGGECQILLSIPAEPIVEVRRLLVTNVGAADLGPREC